MRYAWLWVAGLTALLGACKGADGEGAAPGAGGGARMPVRSPAFAEGGMIPGKYSCQGEDLSPPIEWDSVPGAAKSLALICDDPDAPMGRWVHWVLFDMPPDLRLLHEGMPKAEKIECGAAQGMNDFGKIGYGGPCPPGGTHRYFFTLYALDTKLNLKGRVTKARLLNEMKGHVIAEGTLIGKYRK